MRLVDHVDHEGEMRNVCVILIGTSRRKLAFARLIVDADNIKIDKKEIQLHVEDSIHFLSTENSGHHSDHGNELRVS
jgi:ribosomal protein S9